MKISIASDHAGFEKKETVKKWLTSNGYEVIDYGTTSPDSVDYPDFAFSAAESVSENKSDYGIIICGTGIGVSITANKVKGIRAANCCTSDMAQKAREHNDANVLTFGARVVSEETAIDMVKEFLSTDFAGGRHEIRVKKIHTLTGR